MSQVENRVESRRAEQGRPHGLGHIPIPVLQGVLPFRGGVGANVVAGLTLAALAIPEVMGYARIAGTPVITGLYTILLPIALFALFGSSRHLVVGADSATAAIMAAALGGLARTGSAHWTALASLLALMTGLVLALARIARLGFLADFLSRTVLTGFLTGVGVQVALGEVPALLGLHPLGPSVFGRLWQAARAIGSTSLWDLGVALAVVVAIVGFRRLSRRIPGALIAVVAAIIASFALRLGRLGVDLVGSVPGGLPALGPPPVDWSLSLVWRLLPTAVALAVVILGQSAATARAYAWRYDERFNADTDLVGLALANLGAAFTGTFVVNGSPTKTQMVDAAGGRSQLSQLVTAGVVLLVLLFLTGPFAYLPQAALSAVVFLIGLELIDVAGMRRILAVRPGEFWVALITAFAVVLFGVERAILIAMALSLLNHVRRGYRPKNSLLVSDAEGGVRMAPADEPEEIRSGLIVYRFNHAMYYANAEQLSEQVMRLAQDARPPLRWFALDMDAVDDVDFSAAATLKSLRSMLGQRAVELVYLQVDAGVREALGRYGLLGEEAQAFSSLKDLLEGFGAAPQQGAAGGAAGRGPPASSAPG